MAQNARDTAVTALIQWEREQTYSNIMMDNFLKQKELSEADAAFATRLVYGVIERLLTIDWILQKFSNRSVKSCHPTVRAVLRVGVYQLLFMHKIPSSAAVNEAVGQVKRMKQGAASGFVNGVLRAVARDGQAKLASLTTDLKGQSVRHSVPLELLTAWKKAYGLQTAVELAQVVNEAPPSVIRINTLKTDIDQMKSALLQQEISFDEVEGLSAALVIHNTSLLKKSTISEEWYYFQDTASQWACRLLGAKEGETIMDVCAAPGGKSFTTAMYMNGNGTIVSCDIYEEKVATIARRAAHYGIRCIKAIRRDAALPAAEHEKGAFDRVICDVPCSGYGVIRRKPEIRYKSLKEFEELPALQYHILCEAAKLVKDGGILQYSTCTLRPEENEEVVSRFLHDHSEFVTNELEASLLFEQAKQPPSHCITLLPSVHGTDGFFIASFRKEVRA